MSKNSARSQIAEPILTPADVRPAPASYVPDVAAMGEQIVNADGPVRVYRDPVLPVGDMASRALTAGAAVAREYAAAAGELCRTADVNAQARASARRLLRLALAHLEG